MRSLNQVKTFNLVKIPSPTKLGFIHFHCYVNIQTVDLVHVHAMSTVSKIVPSILVFRKRSSTLDHFDRPVQITLAGRCVILDHNYVLLVHTANAKVAFSDSNKDSTLVLQAFC